MNTAAAVALNFADKTVLRSAKMSGAELSGTILGKGRRRGDDYNNDLVNGVK